MKSTFALILLILFFSNSAFSKDDWKKYEFPKSKFKIEFPQEPEYTIDTNQIDTVASLDYTYNWSVEMQDSTHPNYSYIITSREFPKDYIHSDSSESFINDIFSYTQADYIDNKEFKFDNSSLLEYNGYPGKEYNWTCTEIDYFITTRVYLIQNRLYFLSIMKHDGHKYNTLATKFFESFETIGIPKGTYTLPKNDEDDTYEINFAEAPKVENKLHESQNGTIFLKLKTLEKGYDSDTIIYISSEINYKQDVIDKNNPTALNNLYKNSMDGFLRSTNGELSSLNEVQYNYNMGKEFKGYIMNRAIMVTGRLFYINNHLYMHYVMTNPMKDNTKHVKTFLDSFKLKKIKQ